ncbi:MAG: hypothetical protein V1886_02720 [archaeon]
MVGGEAGAQDAVKQLGGNISLINFDLDPMQAAVVRKVVGNYVKRLGEIVEYKELKIRLRKHEHGKSTLNEIDANAYIIHEKEVTLNASASGYNLYSALAEVLEKIIAEAMHQNSKK